MVKTGILLAGFTALFLLIGYLIGGTGGMMMALIFAVATNFFSYWFSDKIVLSMYDAQPLDPADNPRLYDIIDRMAKQAGIPTPKAYLINTAQPNAFATGRNPANGALAITTGLLRILNEEEIAAVLSHEMGHIRNYDTLTMTVTATIAGAIGMLANIAMFFGGSRDAEGRSHPLAALLVALFAPLAAMIVQLAISRTREYSADAAGAEISHDPMALASALRKISAAAEHVENIPAQNNPATAHMFIINPLEGTGMDNLFSTHPNTENRIRALEEMAVQQGKTLSPAASGWGNQNRATGTYKSPWKM